MIQIAVERMAGKELVVRAKQFINEIDVRFKELEKDYEALEKEYKGLKEKYEDLKQEESEFPKAYDLGYEKGFENGEYSMQEKANKIIEFYRDNNNDIDVLQKVFSRNVIFGDLILEDIKGTYNKIIEYEEKEQRRKEFHVGDEVIDKDGKKYVVRLLEGAVIYAMSSSCKSYMFSYSEVSKTGKHYPLDEILKELK